MRFQSLANFDDMEIWGGIECTINRVKDQYFDQLAYQNHYDRPEDIDLLIDLGIKKIRYPILWEKYGVKAGSPVDWEPISKSLNHLREAGVEVIAGLVHHGSGPMHVDIREESFAIGLADFARTVAKRFPWIKFYTPVNEPLTTARFCGLYGLWFPHEKSTQSFLRILINECKGTILAMNAIREVNPTAELVLTEDLGHIHSTKLLQYQADFENHRKWLGIDLVCGKVDRDHVLWEFLINHEVSEDDLQFFLEKPFCPVIIGFNYYVTSERYLDEKIDLYPPHIHGGNGRHQYADVEVVRCADCEIIGLKTLLKEAWNKYQLPLAVTEAHLSCDREEQLRWIRQIWDWVNELANDEVEVKAITIWALFGAHGWDKLLTTAKGSYESGAFDISAGKPRPTAIAKMVRSLAHSGAYQHPLLAQKGWWAREDRIIYPQSPRLCGGINTNCTPVLVIGASGTLGTAFTKKLSERKIHSISLNRSQLNVTDVEQIRSVIQKYKPWAIINAAGFVDVDNAEISKDVCFLSNTIGPRNLAKLCNDHGVKLVTFSTDLVFDGKKNTEYEEHDLVNPLNVYGLSKAHAEEQVISACKEALIIRTCAFFGPWDEYNFVAYIRNGLRENRSITIADDVYISPTYVPDLVDMTLNLLIDDESGIWHLSNQGTLTWFDLANEVAARTGGNRHLLKPMPIATLGLQAIRPAFSALRSTKGATMPTLENALERLFSFPNMKSA